MIKQIVYIFAGSVFLFMRIATAHRHSMMDNTDLKYGWKTLSVWDGTRRIKCRSLNKRAMLGCGENIARAVFSYQPVAESDCVSSSSLT